MASGSITSWQIDGETMETVTEFIFLGSKITADGDRRHEVKKQRHYFADKGPSSPSYGFSSSHVWMIHSSTLAWKIPWMEEPGRLQSMGLLRVGHDWSIYKHIYICLSSLLKHLVVWNSCCCCQVTSVVANSVWPHRQQPTRLHHPWDSPGKNTGVGCHFLLNAWKWKVKVKLLSRVDS